MRLHIQDRFISLNQTSFVTNMSKQTGFVWYPSSFPTGSSTRST